MGRQETPGGAGKRQETPRDARSAVWSLPGSLEQSGAFQILNLGSNPVNYMNITFPFQFEFKLKWKFQVKSKFS